MGKAYNQHYVPRLLLKRWADENGEVWRYRTLVSHKTVPVWRKVAVSVAASRPKFYGQDGFEEDINGKIETDAAPVIDAAITGGRLTRESWQKLVAFFALQLMRTPKGFEKITKIMRNDFVPFIRNVIEKQSNTDQIPTVSPVYDPDHPIRAYTNSVTGESSITADIGPAGWLGFVRNEVGNFKNMMLTHRWTILRAPPGQNFYLSDEPAISNPKDPEVFLPISPTHILYAKIGTRRPPKRYSQISAENLKRFNKRIADSGHLALFAKRPDDCLEQIRPRTIDADEYVRQESYWKSFHELPLDEVSTTLNLAPGWLNKVKKNSISEIDCPDNNGKHNKEDKKTRSEI